MDDKKIIQKTKEHFKRNKDRYIVGGAGFILGGIVTYVVAKRPIIRSRDVKVIVIACQNQMD